MDNSASDSKQQKWSNVFNQSPFKKFKSKQHNNVIKTLFKKNPKSDELDQQDMASRQSEQRNYMRLMKPYEPTYEIEWQKNQWLQLDHATNKQIERLRKNGFTKMTIRKDASIKKHLVYDHATDMDVLLELSLHNNDVNQHHDLPYYYSVRRIHWWHTSYQVGEAYLPNNYSDTSSEPSSTNSSQSSSFNSMLLQKQLNQPINFKPLTYTEPVYFIDE